jgi:hypothetical protein
MSDEGRVEVVIDELVLDGVDPATVPVLLRAIEEALALTPPLGADEVAGVVSGAVTRAVQAGGDR